MSMMTVPSLEPGERSLPAELRTRRGRGFAHRRLMNGMRGIGGLGDDTTDTTLPDLNFTDPISGLSIPDAATAAAPSPSGSGVFNSPLLTGTEFSLPPSYSGPTSVPAGQTPPAAPSGYQWVAAANNATQSLAKILAISQGGTVMQLPNGQQVITGAPNQNVGVLGTSGVAGSISAYLPYLLLAGGAFLVMSMMGRNR